MAIKANTTTRTPYRYGDESAYDAELVNLASIDYVPAVPCRGFIITGATGTVVLTTLAGTVITLPSGLLTGVIHAIAFTQITKTGTTATGLVALT